MRELNKGIPIMTGDGIAMSNKERQSYHLLMMVLERKIILQDAGRLMRISYRRAKQLKRKVVSEGARGLVDGNRDILSLRP